MYVIALGINQELSIAIFQHKNYNLPIRDQKKSKKSFSTKKSKHQFNPEVEGFESDERQFETVKREGAHSVHNNQGIYRHDKI